MHVKRPRLYCLVVKVLVVNTTSEFSNKFEYLSKIVLVIAQHALRAEGVSEGWHCEVACVGTFEEVVHLVNEAVFVAHPQTENRQIYMGPKRTRGIGVCLTFLGFRIENLCSPTLFRSSDLFETPCDLSP